MEELKKQTEKSLTKQCNPKQLETLDLAKNIVAGTVNVGAYEIGLSIDKNLDKPVIRSLFKNENGHIGFSVVKILVNRFIESFGFSTKLSETQLEILTYDTLEKFSFDSFEDIVLFFKMARSGTFGTTKRGVDSNLIFGEWFPMYMEMKAEAREREQLKQKKQTEESLLSIEEVKKSYEKIKPNNTFRDRVIVYIDKITQGMTRLELEDLIQAWSEDDQKKEYLNELKIKRLTIK
jgi:hypothetical protein